jgi:hypothetical protein
MKGFKENEFIPTVLWLGIYLLSLSAHEQGLGSWDVGPGYPYGTYHERFFFKSNKCSGTLEF